jgi:hypothetical protein
MAAGLWSHRDLVEGVYDIQDLLDAHEYLDVKEENERRDAEWRANHREEG